MSSRVVCPACQAVCTVPEGLTATMVRCGKCLQHFRVDQAARPSPASESEATPPEEGVTTPSVARRLQAATPNRRQAPPVDIPELSRLGKQPRSLVVWLVAGAGLGIMLLALIAGWWLVIDSERPRSVLPAPRPDGEAEKAGMPAPPLRPGTKPPLQEHDPVERPLPAPVADVALAALAPRAALKPPLLEQEQVERPLPAPVADVAVGGSGRFLILHLPAVQKLAIFDVNEAKVVHYHGVADANVKFAAGRHQLMLVLPDQGILQRWSLLTHEMEASAPLPIKGVIKTVSMGRDSGGPLLIHSAVGGNELDHASYAFLDIRTLQVADIKWYRDVFVHNTTFRDKVHIRAAAAGNVFGLWCTSHDPSGLETIVVRDGEARPYYKHEGVGHVVPGPDGRLIYTARGIFTSELKPVGQFNRFGSYYCLPAHQRPFYLAIALERGKTVSIHAEGDALPHVRPLVPLPNIPLPKDLNPFDREPLGADKRLHLIPDAQLLVVIPETNDRLILRRVDLEAALTKPGSDYFFVTSAPPPTAKPGSTYSYPLEVKSSKGGLVFSLASGPKGMEISPAGLVRWQVPKDAVTSEVRVSIVNDANHECLHTFTIHLGDADAKEAGQKDVPQPVEQTVREDPPNPRPEHMTLQGHGGDVTAVKFTPDGKSLISAGKDSQVKLWDLATGKEKASLGGVDDEIHCLALSPDGKTAAASGVKGGVRVFKLADADGGHVLEPKSFMVMSGVDFSPDGKTVVTGNATGTIKFWDLAANQQRNLIKAAGIACLAFSPNGATLAVGHLDENPISLWDVAKGQQRASLKGHFKGNQLAPVWTMAFSPDGKTLASGGHDAAVLLWDMEKLQPRATLRHFEPVTTLAISSDGKLLASSGWGGEVRFWDVATAKSLGSLRSEPRTWVRSLAISPDTKQLAVSHEREVRIWNLNKLLGRGATAAGPPPEPDKQAVKPPANTPAPEQISLENRSTLVALAVTPDGRNLVSAHKDAEVNLWDLATGRRTASLRGNDDQIRNMVLSPNGKTAATCGVKGSVQLFNLEKRDTEPLEPKGSMLMMGLAFSPDGKLLATGHVSGELKLWDLSIKEPGKVLKFKGIICAAFSPDGKSLAVAEGRDGPVILLDVNTGMRLAALSGHFQNDKPISVIALAFSADGKTLATASYDATVQLWDVQKRQIRSTLRLDSSMVLAFSPDGTMLATGSAIGIRLWDVAGGKMLALQRGEEKNGIQALAFTPDGKRLVSARQRDIQLYDMDKLLQGRRPQEKAL